MSDHEKVADLLDTAADHIEKNGWWQGGWECIGEASCAVLAIDHADPSWSLEVAEALQSSLGLAGEPFSALIGWNDAAGRTAQEVLDALRLSAKQERILADEAS